MSRYRLLIALLSGTPVLLILALLSTPARIDALPQYTARAGRTCDNCHADPTGWTDPALLDRKCSLDCSTCHWDPTGGGLRTVGGMYYGLNTLSLFGAPRRPWADRLLLGEEPPDERAGPTRQPTSQPSADLEAADRRGVAAFGTPARSPSPWAFRQGRYGGLNADPVLQIGGDLRLAFFFANGRMLFFPMQTDLSVALHPIEHLTLYVEAGAQGSTRGIGNDTVVAGEAQSRFGLHEVFLMTHEWPGNTYLKVGRFVPPFGWRLDDHTAPTRRELGFDQGRPSTFVSGVEIGAVANYPYLNVAAFQLDAGQSDFFPDNGEGVSTTAGWRDLAWGAGGSFYWSSSDVEKRTMGGLTWYLNPWVWWERVPLTYLGEVDLVDLDRPDRSRRIRQLALFHELDWRFRPGTQLRFRYDYFDEDLDVDDDAYHRLNLGIDVFFWRFTELQTVGRLYMPEIGGAYGDFLVTLRLWY